MIQANEDAVQQYISMLNSSQWKKLYEQCYHHCNRNHTIGTPSTKFILSLRKSMPQDWITFALEVAIGTLYAQQAGKYEEGCLYIQSQTEQSTRLAISCYHADALVTDDDTVLEVCTGAGSDTRAFARRCKQVTTLDIDPRAIALSRYNADHYKLDNIRSYCVDAETFFQENSALQKTYTTFWADPARRNLQRRVSVQPNDYQPSLMWLVQQASAFTKAGIKLSPALNSVTPLHWQREWIGFENECKEQLWWKDPKTNYSTPKDIVTIITSSTTSHQFANDENSSSSQAHSEQSSSSNYQMLSELPLIGSTDFVVCDPHAALARSGRISEFYEHQSISLFHKDCLYGWKYNSSIVTDTYDMFVRWYSCDTFLPFNEKVLVDICRKRKWNRNTIIKKRGVDINPDKLFQRLPLAHDGLKTGVIILLRTGSNHWMALGTVK